MSRASPKMRHFAKRLAAYERRQKAPSDSKAPPAFQVCEKLRVHLAVFMGSTGFRELMSCALPRAKAEAPWLGAVHVNAKRNPNELFEGGVVLVAQLLGLLTAFIGQTLTLRFVREVWPTVPLDDLDLGKGGKDEKTE